MEENLNQNQVSGNDATEKNTAIKNSGFEVLSIGMGQGGGSLSIKLKETLSEGASAILINLSSNDLNAADIDTKYKLKLGDIEGAGQNRDIAKSIIKDEASFDKFLRLYRNMLFRKNRIVLVAFTTAGGSGSGSAPYFLARLTKFVQQFDGDITIQKGDSLETSKMDDSFRPTIIGVGILPSLESDSEGIKALQNTVENLKELNTLVEKKAISLMLVSNDKSEYSMDKEVKNLFNDINSRTSKALYRLYRVFGESNVKSLDASDRLTAINMPGFMSLMIGKLSENGVFEDTTPFVVPESTTFRRMIAELPEEFSKDSLGSLTEYLNSKEIKYADSRIGYTKPNPVIPGGKLTPEEAVQPLVLLTGMPSISKIAEQYAQKLEVLLDKQKKLSDNLIKTGEGFENLEKTKNKLNNEERKSLVDDDLLNDL